MDRVQWVRVALVNPSRIALCFKCPTRVNISTETMENASGSRRIASRGLAACHATTAHSTICSTMFKSLAKDLAGTADICVTLTDLRKSLAVDYLLPRETILFSFQSAKEEFAFTNEALITIKGENGTTTRKLIRRYPWRNYLVTYVQFETTGRVDRDCEIKFMIGKEEEISIDITKKEEQAVKKYYKALLALQREQEKRRYDLSFSAQGMHNVALAVRMDGMRMTEVDSDVGPLGKHASHVLSYLQQDFEKLNSRCYRDVIVAALRLVSLRSSRHLRARDRPRDARGRAVLERGRSRALWSQLRQRRVHVHERSARRYVWRLGRLDQANRKRFEYQTNATHNVRFETSGVADRDCELKLAIGTTELSIDIAKAEVATAQRYYRVLQALSRTQHENMRDWEFAKLALDASVRSTTNTTTALVDQADAVHAWYTALYNRTNPRCYRSVLETALTST